VSPETVVTGSMLAWYRGDAFVVMHGSWNRAPSPMAGYNVMFRRQYPRVFFGIVPPEEASLGCRVSCNDK
jgi:glucose/arabinose dehydrogenase